MGGVTRLTGLIQLPQNVAAMEPPLMGGVTGVRGDPAAVPAVAAMEPAADGRGDPRSIPRGPARASGRNGARR